MAYDERPSTYPGSRITDDTRRRFMSHFAGPAILSLAKAYRDAAAFHLKKPTRIEG